MFPKPKSVLVPNAYAYESEPMVKATEFAKRRPLAVRQGNQPDGHSGAGHGAGRVDCGTRRQGGCYAKCIKLSKEAEPESYAASKRFGAVLETWCLTREPDFDDGLKTENTRSAYPLEFIPSASRSDRAGHPKNLVCRRRFGVMPPIAKLTPAQAISLKLWRC